MKNTKDLLNRIINNDTTLTSSKFILGGYSNANNNLTRTGTSWNKILAVYRNNNKLKKHSMINSTNIIMSFLSTNRAIKHSRINELSEPNKLKLYLKCFIEGKKIPSNKHQESFRKLAENADVARRVLLFSAPYHLKEHDANHFINSVCKSVMKHKGNNYVSHGFKYYLD